jgi:tRNA threonylcarbamoyladenosine biosynthesis protein TsaB
LKILYFDTNTEWLVIQLFEISLDNKIHCILKESRLDPKNAGKELVFNIQSNLEKANIVKPDLIVVANGPGSFTGIRITVSVGKNLSQLWNIPVLGYPTLEVYSSYYYFKYSQNALVILDGKMSKYFCGGYNSKGFHNLVDIIPKDLETVFQLSNYSIYSNTNYPNSKSISEDFPDASFLINRDIQLLKNTNIEEFNYKTLNPIYMRETYAQEKR